MLGTGYSAYAHPHRVHRVTLLPGPWPSPDTAHQHMGPKVEEEGGLLSDKNRRVSPDVHPSPTGWGCGGLRASHSSAPPFLSSCQGHTSYHPSSPGGIPPYHSCPAQKLEMRNQHCSSSAYHHLSQILHLSESPPRSATHPKLSPLGGRGKMTWEGGCLP